MKAARTSGRDASGPAAQLLATEVAELFYNLVSALFDPYRPGRHYMRGPGPKWHARQRRLASILPRPAGRLRTGALSRVEQVPLTPAPQRKPA